MTKLKIRFMIIVLRHIREVSRWVTLKEEINELLADLRLKMEEIE